MGILTLLFIFYTDFRGVWIPRWSIASHDEILSCLDGRFNHIFIQIYAAGEAYYPSKIAPSKISSDQWLRDLLDEAHRRNIKVSAWLNIFYSWGYGPRPDNPLHPINCNPDWYAEDQAGRSILDYDRRELTRCDIEGYYLAPANSQVRLYLTKIIGEVMKYDFDGIHLDYIRYPNREFVYDVSLRSKFMREYYFEPKDFSAETDILKTRLSLWGYNDIKNQWHDFVNNDLTNFIRDLSRNIKTLKPNMQISVAVKPDYLTARNQFYQEWVNWLNSDLIDFVCLMAYSKNISGILDRTLKIVKEPQRVAVGLGLFNSDAKEIKKQVDLVKNLPFAGVVFFSYEELSKHREYLSSIR